MSRTPSEWSSFHKHKRKIHEAPPLPSPPRALVHIQTQLCALLNQAVHNGTDGCCVQPLHRQPQAGDPPLQRVLRMLLCHLCGVEQCTGGVGLSLCRCRGHRARPPPQALLLMQPSLHIARRRPCCVCDCDCCCWAEERGRELDTSDAARVSHCSHHHVLQFNAQHTPCRQRSVDR